MKKKKTLLLRHNSNTPFLETFEPLLYLLPIIVNEKTLKPSSWNPVLATLNYNHLTGGMYIIPVWSAEHWLSSKCGTCQISNVISQHTWDLWKTEILPFPVILHAYIYVSLNIWMRLNVHGLWILALPWFLVMNDINCLLFSEGFFFYSSAQRYF